MKAINKIAQKGEEMRKKRGSAFATELSESSSKKRRGDQTDLPLVAGSAAPLEKVVDDASLLVSAESFARDSKLFSDSFRVTNQFQITGHDDGGGQYACPAPMTSFNMTPFSKQIRKGAMNFVSEID